MKIKVEFDVHDGDYCDDFSKGTKCKYSEDLGFCCHCNLFKGWLLDTVVERDDCTFVQHIKHKKCLLSDIVEDK